MPRLCPDLSATVYGGRAALAAMARAMDRVSEADEWLEKAEEIRRLIMAKLNVEEDAAFYDLDAEGNFVKVRTAALLRVCGEHVPEQRLFDELWQRQIHKTAAFWPAYPLPSVALDDATFVRPIPANSWGGASQALTALRATRWMEHYGRGAELGQLMALWFEAIQRDETFRQQVDPVTGEFTQGDAPGYSPCALAMVEFTWRLAGVCEEADELHWNVRPACGAAGWFRMKTDAGKTAEMRYGAGGAGLMLGGRSLGRIEGGAARLVTDKAGAAKELMGIEEQAQRVTVQLHARAQRTVVLRANERVTL